MLTKESVEMMGRKVAAGGQSPIPAERRVKLARAVIVLMKKAGISKEAGVGWGAALAKLAPLLIPAAAGVGGYFLGKRKQEQPMGYGGYGYGGYGGFGGPKPLWGQVDRRMLGRMGINPQEESARLRAMRDIGAGGAWRAQAHKERMNLIRGMFTS